MNHGVTATDLLIENHVDLYRLGPGSDASTERALSFVRLPAAPRIADMGCGTGNGTMVLARLLPDADITGVDLFPAFVERFNATAASQGVADRVRAVEGSAEEAPIAPASLDAVWSEGVFDADGIARVAPHWQSLLKSGGYLAFTSPMWLTDERPADLVRFWDEAGGVVGSLDRVIASVLAEGFRFVASFALPECDWMEGYFIPREQVGDELRRKYAGDPAAEEFFAVNAREVELYQAHKDCYGYVFCIVQKC